MRFARMSIGMTSGPLLVAMLLACACQAGATDGRDEAASDAAPDEVVAVAAPNEAAVPASPGVVVEAKQAHADESSGADQRASVQPLDIEIEPQYLPWERVLATYVNDEGLVDYAGLSTQGRVDLEQFMRSLATAEPGDMPDDAARIAFWINAYNATVLWQVIEAYPLESVRDVGALWGLVGGFFKKENPIAGENRSLDDIEHGILRADYADARIHWALVCGAFGCPRLLQRPYVAADLDSVLTAQAFEFVSEDRGLRLDREQGALHLSRYFDWYAGDFEAESGSVVDYLLRYASPDTADYLREHRGSLTVSFMEYDWTLNDQSRGPR